MYITTEEYKAIMGLSTLSTVEEAQVEAILPQSKAMIDSMLGELNSDTRIEKVAFGDVFFQGGITKIYTSKLGISEVVSINGVAYIGDRKVDGHRHNIIFLKETFDMLDYPYLEIELVNGYNPIPSDIKFLQAILTSDIISQLKGGDITKKKIGDKELTFSTNTTENKQKFIKSIIDSYLLKHI